jgi:hypothetical protein
MLVAEMPLFHHAKEDEADGKPSGKQHFAPEAKVWEDALRHFNELTLPRRGAEILEKVAPKITAADSREGQDQILAPFLPDLLSTDYSPGQWDSWHELQRVLDEAFGALVLSRLVVRHDQTTNHWGTVTSYSLGPDGKAALERGDVADVVARRLPD